MSDIADFLRARYAEQRAREEGTRQGVASFFDYHEVEIRRETDGSETVLVDGRPYPTDEYYAVATEPAPDLAVLADLDAKLAVVAAYEEAATFYDDPANSHVPAGELHGLRTALRHLAQPFAGHPDYDERWRP